MRKRQMEETEKGVGGRKGKQSFHFVKSML